MPDSRNPQFAAASTFDPVCGTPLRSETGETFFDGIYLHNFCCAMCRRVFIDEWRIRRRTEREKGFAIVH